MACGFWLALLVAKPDRRLAIGLTDVLNIWYTLSKLTFVKFANIKFCLLIWFRNYFWFSIWVFFLYFLRIFDWLYSSSWLSDVCELLHNPYWSVLSLTLSPLSSSSFPLHIHIWEGESCVGTLQILLNVFQGTWTSCSISSCTIWHLALTAANTQTMEPHGGDDGSECSPVLWLCFCIVSKPALYQTE